MIRRQGQPQPGLLLLNTWADFRSAANESEPLDALIRVIERDERSAERVVPDVCPYLGCSCALCLSSNQICLKLRESGRHSGRGVAQAQWRARRHVCARPRTFTRYGPAFGGCRSVRRNGYVRVDRRKILRMKKPRKKRGGRKQKRSWEGLPGLEGKALPAVDRQAAAVAQRAEGIPVFAEADAGIKRFRMSS